MKWAQDATLDKGTSAHDSESFTVLPPLIEPHRNVRLSVLNERLNEPMESQKNYKLGIIEIIRTRYRYDQRYSWE